MLQQTKYGMRGQMCACVYVRIVYVRIVYVRIVYVRVVYVRIVYVRIVYVCTVPEQRGNSVQSCMPEV